MRRSAFVLVWAGALSLVGGSGQAAEYFVTTTGNDAHSGRSRDRAFLTIQRGVEALRAGDTLTITPGEYLESVRRKQLGHAKSDTVIRAAIPGTVLLRGDVPAPSFRQVPGRRFTWVAEFQAAKGVQMVSEADSLTILKPAPSAAERNAIYACIRHKKTPDCSGDWACLIHA